MIAGILPVFGPGLSLPYPSPLYSVEPGKLLIDYSIAQMVYAGVTDAFIPCVTRDMEPMARALGYSRGGLALRYVEVPKDEAENRLNFISRACRLALRSGNYERYLVLSPTVWYTADDWASILGTFEKPPARLGAPGSLFLDQPTTQALALALRTEDGHECLNQLLSKYATPPPAALDLGHWPDVRGFARTL